MSTAEPDPILGARLTQYDRWMSRLAADPRFTRLYGWLAPTFVTLLAAVLRLANVGHPSSIYFDETYYVKDSWSQWNLGYPSSWPGEDDDQRFAAGETDAFSTTASFVVHPPLGRWLIGLGMALFGADSPFGWRIAVAVCGTAMVLLLYAVAYSLTRSIPFATVASLLLAIDGLGIVLSRIAILDVFLAFFGLLAVFFVILDRRRHHRRLADGIRERTVEDEPPGLGPVFFSRPWVLAAGAAAGAATAVKWSGVYVLAAIGLYLVVSDALARRRAGVGSWLTDAARQGVVAFVLLVPIAAAIYLASWTGWIASAGGYDRSAAVDDPATGVFGWVPLWLQSLWTYHEAIYTFHVGLSTPHSAASPAWQWPLLWHPTSMYFSKLDEGADGCGFATGCVEAIASTPNPIVWWASVAASVYLAVRYALTRDWRYGVVLLGIGATYLPWLMYPERTIFQFYTVAILPFLLLALTYALRDIAGRRHGPPHRRTVGVRIVVVFLVVAIAVAVFWYPVLTAMSVPYWFWHIHSWLPTWY